mmetsp:Transcript_7153/g.21858  ORF Transcript_7153/g.21858 Transcript_7153/m.21858 type:complete len:105 (-) Transcript_7153:696-1010(-)
MGRRLAHRATPPDLSAAPRASLFARCREADLLTAANAPSQRVEAATSSQRKPGPARRNDRGSRVLESAQISTDGKFKSGPTVREATLRRSSGFSGISKDASSFQ